MHLANRLRTLMRWRGIRSQNQLARLSGVPQSSIHRILARGQGYTPERRTIDRLAAALGTTPHWLSDGMPPGSIARLSDARPLGEPPREPAGPLAENTLYLAELVTLSSRLALGDLQALLTLVRLIAPAGCPPATVRTSPPCRDGCPQPR